MGKTAKEDWKFHKKSFVKNVLGLDLKEQVEIWQMEKKQSILGSRKLCTNAGKLENRVCSMRKKTYVYRLQHIINILECIKFSSDNSWND